MKATVDSMLDWVEKCLNGEMVGTRVAGPPLWIDGSRFRIIIEPVLFSEELGRKYYEKFHGKKSSIKEKNK